MAQNSPLKKDRCLAMLIRHPESGKVKTRLARTYGDDFAAELYGCFVDDLSEALAPGDYQMKIFFTPSEREPEIRRRFGDRFPCIPQQGEGLGERMANAFCNCFAQGFPATLLIGSDSPDLTAAVIEGAFRALENRNDAVIGPAFDGGYYLIGFRSDTFAPVVFREMIWEESAVCNQTVNLLQTRGYRIHLMPAWHDIDKGEDLTALQARHATTAFSRSRTMTFLRSTSSRSTSP